MVSLNFFYMHDVYVKKDLIGKKDDDHPFNAII